MTRSKLRIFRILSVLLIGVSALFLSGCFESKQDYTINPDGSGKVTIDVLFDPSTVSIGQQSQDPQKQMESAVRKIVKDSKGIDVWSNVTFKRMPDGRVNFKGTAYFPDLSKLDIDNYGTNFTLTKEGSTISLVMKEEKEEKKSNPKAVATSAPQMTDAEIDAAIKEAQGEWQRSKPLMSAMLSGLKKEATVRIPGKLIESNNFTKVTSNILKVSLDGAKLIETLDSAMNDGAWLKQAAMKGTLDPKGGPPMDDSFNQRYFGQPGNVSAKYEPGKRNQFDYRKEVAAANKLYPKVLEALNIVSRTIPGAVLKEGITFATGEIKDNRTSGEFFGGMSVELVMKGDILAHSRGVRHFEILSAQDDKGNDLRKEQQDQSGFSYSYHSGGDSDNQGEMKQQLDLKNPARAAATIQELSGNIELYVPDKDPKSKVLVKGFLKQTGKTILSDSLKKAKVDIAVLNKEQFEAMKKKKEEAEAAGGAPAGKDPMTLLLTAFAESFSGYTSVQDNTLVFLIKDPGNRLVDLEVVDDTGKTIPYSSRSGGSEMRTIDFDGPLPDTAQLAIYVETTTSLVRAPFALNNITLP